MIDPLARGRPRSVRTCMRLRRVWAASRLADGGDRWVDQLGRLACSGR